MDYNTKYVCSYNSSDIFLDSEITILNNDEKHFVRDALYRRDLCKVFKINEENEFDEEIFYAHIRKLYENVKECKALQQITTKLASMFMSNDTQFGFMLLFSFDYLHLAHPCICEFIETAQISDNTFNQLINAIKIF